MLRFQPEVHPDAVPIEQVGAGYGWLGVPEAGGWNELQQLISCTTCRTNSLQVLGEMARNVKTHSERTCKMCPGRPPPG